MDVENFFLKFLFTKSQMCNLFFEVPVCFLFSCKGCTNLSLFFLHLYILTTDPDSYLWLHTLFLTTERPITQGNLLGASIRFPCITYVIKNVLLYVARFCFPYLHIQKVGEEAMSQRCYYDSKLLYKYRGAVIGKTGKIVVLPNFGIAVLPRFCGYRSKPFSFKRLSNTLVLAWLKFIVAPLLM